MVGGVVLEAKELLPQRVVVSLLGSFHFLANLIFFEVRRFPFVDFGNRMIDRG
jgi:hypothetical protein